VPKVEKIKTKLCVDGPVASVKGKLEALKRQTTCGGGNLSKDLAPMDQGNGEEQVKLRSMNQ